MPEVGFGPAGSNAELELDEQYAGDKLLLERLPERLVLVLERIVPEDDEDVDSFEQSKRVIT